MRKFWLFCTIPKSIPSFYFCSSSGSSLLCSYHQHQYHHHFTSFEILLLTYKNFFSLTKFISHKRNSIRSMHNFSPVPNLSSLENRGVVRVNAIDFSLHFFIIMLPPLLNLLLTRRHSYSHNEKYFCIISNMMKSRRLKSLQFSIKCWFNVDELS
jgi:hypothetical protein